MDNNDKGKKENAVVSSRTVSLLIEKIENELKSKPSQLKEFPELKALKEKCCDVNICTAFCACQGITNLVENRILNGSKTVSSLISMLPSIKHYPPLVISVGNILLYNIKEEIEGSGRCDNQYNFTDIAHPFVIILKQDSEKSWNAIYAYIQFLFYSSNEIIFAHKINFLRPFLLYVFCDPTPQSLSHKIALFSLLLKQLDKIEAKNLIIESFAWQKIDINYCLLMHNICRGLIDSVHREHRLILVALTPCLAFAVKWLILNAHNPLVWIDLLSECIRIDKTGASAVLFILSDVLLDTPALFVNELVKMCESILYSLSCNKYVAQKFAAVSLLWMVNPSSLAQPLFNTLETILKFLHVKLKTNEWFKSKNSLNDNPYFKILGSSYREVKMAVEMVELSDNWKNESSVLNWLKRLNATNNTVMETGVQNFVCGIFLYGNDDEILDTSSEILLNLSSGESELSFHLVCLTFFKLTREVEPKRQLRYLRYLMKIGISKETVPLIIGILETLKSEHAKVMLPVVIDLYLKLWKIDNRIYAYLHKTLFNSGENSWEINVMKTIALRKICATSPETYGKSLVSKLSEILNDCDNFPSGIPSAIAIEAVIELCKASVIDITGTWKALKPKLSRDKRREVVISLCKLFSEVPALKSSGAERDALMSDIVPRLWSYAISTDVEIVKASLAALSKFSADSYGPKLLPDVLKADLEVPKQLCKQSSDVSREELLDELEYVPGECWVELIQRIDSRALQYTEDMISSLMQHELNSLPRRFFTHPDEMPEPANYALLPHSSVCRALVFHITKYLDSPQAKGKVVPESVIACLRILSRDYSKCLPTLDWSFLEKFFVFGGDCKKYAVTILTRQATVSKAGRKVLENYMTNFVEKIDNVNDFFFLYSALPFVCNSLTANILRQFLDKTIKMSCTYSVNSGSDHFEKVLVNARIALESKLVPDPRKALLVAQIQNVLTNIPPDNALMKKYAEFLVELPPKTVESIACASPKLPADKIKQSVYIRKTAALHPESENPLVWFNDCVEAVLNMPSLYNFVIDNILDVLRQKRNLNHGTWLTEVMWRIQASVSLVDTPESIKVTLFLLDIFVNCIITLSGYDFFLSRFERDSIKKNTLRFFPIAVHKVLELDEYSKLSPKVIDWIHGFSKWKNLPQEYLQTLEHAILILRNNKFCSEKNKWLHLFYQPAIKCCVK